METANDFFNTDAIASDTPTPKDAAALPFVIDSEERAEWYLRKLANLDAETDRIKANTAKRLQEIATDREGLVQRFGDQLTGWAKGEAERRRRKTVTLQNGSIAFRAVPSRLVIENDADAMQTAKLVCPDAVTVETIEKLDRAALIARATETLQETGELLPGVKMIEASESAKVTAGSKEPTG